MSVPLHFEPDERGVALCALPDYEPSHDGEPLRRWSSLRPPGGPQLTLVAPPPECAASVTPETLWRLVLHVLEVLDGRRPVGQLRTLLTDSAYEALLTRLRVVPPGRQHRLRRLHTCYPDAHVVELSAVIDVTAGPPHPPRVHAAAIRMEQVHDRWRLAVLRVL
ncbi:Rv3235 family protein [Actinophytocola xanthii]|uniref:3-hydroxyacyl-CoA dehydrogenase n=1 Tax=Actinophytocola xanthii TaxID=1912961 RepID=A0A1Q8CXL6_9PSEU|nr:Rv3235 family protein [Actinophytocola xanthii]OLF19096.1 hypothetical protein BU204_03025 [Actinophytocola xanthii]